MAEYEALRREVTAADDARGPGLALFLARGLPAWLTALTALGAGPPLRPVVVPAAPPGPPPLLPASRRELTTVLAGMVLACTPAPEGPPCPRAR